MRLSRRILAAWQAALLAAVLCLAASFAPLPALAEEATASGEAVTSEEAVSSEEAVAPVSEVEQAMNQVPAEEEMFALLYADDTLVLQRGNTPDPSRGELAEAYALNNRWDGLSSCLGSKVGIVTSVIVEDPFVLGERDGSFFEGLSACRSIEGLSLVDTSAVTSMNYMFSGCSSLVSLDLSGFDTSSVTSMAGMFSECSSLESADLSSFDTSNVTDMQRMFSSCSSLTVLDLSCFDTSRVADMGSMFWYCGSLAALDVSSFNTASVTDMGYMFYGCSSLGQLDVSSFNTARVTDMNGMFGGCSALAALDVSGFDTSRVADMGSMFWYCDSLAALDVSSFNTARVTDMSGMFQSCSVEFLDLSSFDTSKVSNGSYMLDCNKLRKVTLGERFVFKAGISLPKQYSWNIPGADGLWHAASGGAYLPDGVPSNKADTYYAVRSDVPGLAPVSVERIAGNYANQTSALISAQGFPEGSEWVVLARDDDFADAMSATGLAGALECPIVLTGQYGLSSAAAEEVQRLGATRAYVIGGTGAMPGDFEGELAALGCTVEQRVFGDYAYDTSVECARLIAQHGGGADAIVAMGTNFQDALSISSFAYAYKLPIFLTTPWEGRDLPASAVAAIKGMSGTIWVPGGPGAVPETAVEYVFGGRTITRLYGYDGYETSNYIARFMVEQGYLSAENCVVACGAQGPKGTDALAGAALAGKHGPGQLGGPMLLVNGNSSLGGENFVTIDEQGDWSWMTSCASSVGHVWVLGGEYVMPQSAVNRIKATLGV
ncbi:BspA family leucine-rich repeat surface protein [Slackia sp.]|uniref:BspA family leucine-rich repeat surface protein n=1 Tax=Slackia sp. TaxID=2049041 RepID=UPI003A97B358